MTIYKMHKDLILTILSLFLLYTVKSQCLINNLRYTVSECQEDQQFFVEIDFDHSGSGSQFRVIGNGSNYGIYSYSNLPVTVGPLSGNCSTIYEFAIRDVQNANCVAFKGLGKICCSQFCTLEIAETIVGECNGTGYDLLLNLNHQSPPASNFSIYNNGQFFGNYTYSSLPLQLTDFPSSNFETFNEVVVCAGSTALCCDTTYILNPCICSIYDVRGRVTECNDENQTFGVKINFKYNLTSDSFQLGGNSTNYGVFAYSDLPVTISSLPMNDNIEYEFLLVDKNDAFCFNTYEAGIIDTCMFECQIKNFSAQIMNETNNEFYVELNFDTNHPGVDGYLLFVNDSLYGNFSYNETSKVFGPFLKDCETLYAFEITDAEIGECTNRIQFDEVICINEDPCTLGEITILESCENNDLISFDLYVEFEGNVNDSFSIEINGIPYGVYRYVDIPLTITNLAFGLPEADILISDLQKDTCSSFKPYTFNCFPKPLCEITELNISPELCDLEGNFIINLQFEASDYGENGFSLFINGEFYDSLNNGEFQYSTGVLAGDCETIYGFTLISNDFEECRESISLSEPVCCDDDCMIDSVVFFDPTACVEGFYNVYLNFFHQNTSEMFDLRIDDEIFGTFRYDELPVLLQNIQANNDNITFRITDYENGPCAYSDVIPLVECSSSVGDLHMYGIQVIILNDMIQLIDKKSPSETQCRLFNTTGQVMWTGKLNGYLEISKTQLPAGIYYLQLRSGTKMYNLKILNIGK
jgi:hypothetical protein